MNEGGKETAPFTDGKGTRRAVFTDRCERCASRRGRSKPGTREGAGLQAGLFTDRWKQEGLVIAEISQEMDCTGRRVRLGAFL